MIIRYYLFVIIPLLISIAYLTLLERKALGYIQLRKGPNKVGLLQPWADGLKLFTKNLIYPSLSVGMLFIISPLRGFILRLLRWSLVSIPYCSIDYTLGVVYFRCISSLTIYTVVIAGWSSNSIYASLGSYRSVAQMISYEVALVIILLSVVSIVAGYNLLVFDYWYGLIRCPLILVWFSSILAEVNRSPYDFAEGESELVSGYNIEYGSGLFSLLFLSEYGNILFISYLRARIRIIKSTMILIVILVLWVRASYPRLRYDKLIVLAWKCYLPFSLGSFILIIGLKSEWGLNITVFTLLYY